MREKDEFPATGCDTGVYTVMQREVNAINHVWLRSKTNDSAQNHLIPAPPYSHTVLHDNIHRAYINIYALRTCRWRRFNFAARQSHEQQIIHPYAREKYIGHNFRLNAVAVTGRHYIYKFSKWLIVHTN